MRRIINRTLGIVPKPGTAFFFSLLVAGHSIQASHAGEIAYGLGYLGEYSDNIRREPVNPVSEWINSAIMGVAYRENGPALDAHLLAQAEYRDYRNDIFNDGSFYYADASAIWRVLPQRLTWYMMDRYDQVQQDVTSPDTPANRVNANVFSTGPDLFIRLGQVNTLVLGLRYGNASYSEGGLGNNRYGASARWQYAANTETTYSLNYEGERLKYDNNALINNVLIDDFMRHDLFIRAERRRARALFLLDLGATRIDRDLTGETSGYLARLRWSQQLTSGSSAGIQLASEYLDAGTVLLSTTTSPTPAPGDPSASPATGEATNDVFYTKRVEVYYNRNDSNFDLNSGVYYRDVDYEIALSQDRRESGGRLELTYRPSILLATMVYANHLDTEYMSSTRHDRESETGIRFAYRVTRYLNATLDGRRNWRYSTDASQEYTDRRVLLSLLYSSSPFFAPARR